MKTLRLPLLAMLSLFAGSVLADPPRTADPTPDPAAHLAKIRKLVDGLVYQKGTVVLKDGLARITLPESYRYLSPTDASTVLSDIWRNPRGAESLGMIVPAGFNPLHGGNWAVVITYDEDGYVKDDDAAKINYADLLKEMQEGTKEASEQRTKAGYAAIELVGWAAPPRYDAHSHKLYWAKEIKFGNEPDHTLNYNIRMLGRRGVLVVNAVAGMDQLQEVEAATPTLLAMVDFQEGHRYTDFNGDTDKVATYGLAALVAGGIAAKTGLLKLLWVGLLAMKKFIILALIALAGYSKRLWAWIRGRERKTTVTDSTPAHPSPPHPPDQPAAGT